MRHIASLLAGLVIAPIAWILIGAATIGLDPHGLYEDTAGKPSSAVSMAMFAVAGIALGLLAVTRMSPAGPVTAAIGFGGLFAFFRFVAQDFALPSVLQSVKIPAASATAAGQSGVVLAIAALLAVAVLIPSRWRGKDDDADRVVDTSELSTPRDPQRNTDAVDPFAPAFTDSDRQSGGGTSAFPSVGNGFDERPTDPFGGGRGQSGQSVPEQRSPYADDAYEGQGYGQSAGYQNQQPPRYGETQQPQQQFGYGNEQQYR